MTFSQSIATCLINYADFNGRATRSEYWWFFLFSILVSLALGVIDLLVFPAVTWGPIGTLGSLALLIPSLAVGARRLHDINRTGWWQLLILTGLGVILLIYWFVCRGTAGSNRFGEERAW